MDVALGSTRGARSSGSELARQGFGPAGLGQRLGQVRDAPFPGTAVVPCLVADHVLWRAATQRTFSRPGMAASVVATTP
jgi:hypothetical protein